MTKKYKPFYQKNGGSHAEYISLHESLIRMEEYNYHSTQLDLNSAAS